jgi:hypothetical protein
LTPRIIAVLVVAGALALPGCGGSSPQASTSTVTIALGATSAAPLSSASTTSNSTSGNSSQQQSNSAGTTGTTGTTGPPAAGTHHVGHRSPQRGSHHVTPIPKHHTGSAKVTGPSPIVCLDSASLIAAKSEGANRWIARNDATLKPVFVDGPFKNVASARADVASLQGIEYVKRGGLYVVGAILTSHLNKTVDAVAACLSTTRGSGTLTF